MSRAIELRESLIATRRGGLKSTDPVASALYPLAFASRQHTSDALSVLLQVPASGVGFMLCVCYTLN